MPGILISRPSVSFSMLRDSSAFGPGSPSWSRPSLQCLDHLPGENRFTQLFGRHLSHGRQPRAHPQPREAGAARCLSRTTELTPAGRGSLPFPAGQQPLQIVPVSPLCSKGAFSSRREQVSKFFQSYLKLVSSYSFLLESKQQICHRNRERLMQ